MSQDDYHDFPDLESVDDEELEGGDAPEEEEDAESPFENLTDEEWEEGRRLGEEIDPEDDESGTDPEDDEFGTDSEEA